MADPFLPLTNDVACTKPCSLKLIGAVVPTTECVRSSAAPRPARIPSHRPHLCTMLIPRTHVMARVMWAGRGWSAAPHPCR